MKCIQPDRFGHKEVIKQFLEVTASRVKNLILRIDQSMNYWSFEQLEFCDPVSVLKILEKLFNEGHPLPSVINLLIHEGYMGVSTSILEF